MAARRDRELAAYLDARGPSLLLLAHQLTGNADRAEAVLVPALQAVHRRWAQLRDGDLDETVRAALVRAVVRGQRAEHGGRSSRTGTTGPARSSDGAASTDPRAATWARLQALTPRRRALLVLRYGEDRSPADIAELLGGSPHAVEAELLDARAALAAPVRTAAPTPTISTASTPRTVDLERMVDPEPPKSAIPSRSTGRPEDGARHAAVADAEELLREVLRDPPDPPPTGDDLAARVLAANRTRRRRRLRIGGAAAAVAAVVAAAALVGPQLGDDDAATTADGGSTATAPPPPPAATDPRLVDWAPRGELAGDSAFIAEVADVWRTGPGASARPPGEVVQPLWAGTIGAGRLAIVQSVSPEGQAHVAQVADREGRLTLDRVEPLAEQDPPALVVDYDGDLELPNLVLGSGAALLALVVPPGDGDVAVHRRSRSVPQGLPGARFNEVDVRDDGLTDSWLHLVEEEQAGTIIAIVGRDGPLAGRVTVVAARPTQIAAERPAVSLDADPWGPGPNGDLEAYDDAVVAVNALAEPPAPLRAGVLWSGRLYEGHASVFRVRDAEGGGGDTVLVSVRRRSQSVCTGRAAVPAELGDQVLVTCTTSDSDLTLLLGATPDTRVTLVDATGAEVASGVGMAWARTALGSPPPVAAPA